MRLLAGILAGQNGRFELIGDESLSSRPMERVAEPLRRMGAQIETDEGHAPLVVDGSHVAGDRLRAADGLGAGEVGRAPRRALRGGRDDRRRALAHAGSHGASARARGRSRSGGARRASRSRRAESLSLGEIEIPGDFSSAAALLVAAVTVPGSDVTVHAVGLNPRRTGLLDVLERMGARVAVYNRRPIGGEPAGDVQVRASELVGATVVASEVPSLVDELPLLALAACHARGETVVTGAAELKLKESDRIEGVVEELRRIGAHIRATPDGFRVRGVPARLRGGTFDARGDHRLAMVGAVAGISSREGVDVRGAEAVDMSFPGFFRVLEQLRIAP